MDTEKQNGSCGETGPLGEEKELNDLKVDGSIPTELDGIYVRTGPNQKMERVLIGSWAMGWSTE